MAQRLMLGPLMARQPLFARAIPLAVLVYLLWGLIFTTVADARVDLGAGTFGLSDGISTTITYAIAAYLSALVGTRIIEVVRTAEWWRPRHTGMGMIDAEGRWLREIRGPVGFTRTHRRAARTPLRRRPR